MQLFSRKSRAASSKSSAVQSDTSSCSHARHHILLAAISATVGVLTVSTLIYFTNLKSSAQTTQQYVSASILSTATTIIKSELKEVQAETSKFARNENVIHNLQQNNTVELQQLADAARSHLRHSLQVRIRPIGDHSLDTTGPAPMNFAAIDLLRKAEAGETVLPELSKQDNDWWLQSVAAIKSQGHVIGTVLITYDATIITSLLSAASSDKGQLAIQQRIDNGNFQTVLKAGQGVGTFSIQEPVSSQWQLSFTPASTIYNLDSTNTLGLIISTVIGLIIVLAGVIISGRLYDQAIRLDAARLMKLIQDQLSARKTAIMGYRLPIFQNIATSLVELIQMEQPTAPSSRPPAPPKEAVQSPPDKTAAFKPLPPMGIDAVEVTEQPSPKQNTEDAFDNPLFQSHEILEIEELDDEFLLNEEDDKEGDNEPAQTQGHDIPKEIFRAYDIRGVVGNQLTPENSHFIGQAIGSELIEQNRKNIVVGRDGRLSSPDLAEQLIAGLNAAGIDVVDIGIVPSPILYFATYDLGIDSGVIVTGSHNSAQYNGFKIIIAGTTLAEQTISKLYERITKGEFHQGSGQTTTQHVNQHYIDRICEDIVLANPISMVIDCGNGVAGKIAPQLFYSLGCDVTPLHCEVDGRFPHHHPDPSRPENLAELQAKVKEVNADIGIAFDGDGDRLGVVTNQGKIIWPDRLLMLLAKDILTRNPGTDVIYDVKCSSELGKLISGYGGRPVIWKTGHSLIKAKMQESEALLAGEFSGHIFFKERWYGFDDGLYTAARLLEILAADELDSDSLFAAIPENVSTPELHLALADDKKFEAIQKLIDSADFGDGNITSIDGIRVDFDTGWGLVRASNTTPALVLRFEAIDENSLQKVQGIFKEQLNKALPDLNIPF